MCTISGSDLSLNSVVDFLWSKAVSDGTRQTYSQGMKCFRTFLALNHYGVDGSLPTVNEDLLLLFVAHCYDNLHLRYSTIQLYLSGIRHFYLRTGIENVLCTESYNLPRLHTILRSIKRLQGPAVKRRLPITFNILMKLCTALRNGAFSPFINLMLEAAFCVAFFGFLRCGEFTCNRAFNPDINLTVGDVKIQDDQSSLSLTLKASKTDPFRKGVTIHLFPTSHYICPVKAVQNYLSALPEQCKEKGNALFLDNQLLPLTRQFFLTQLKNLLERLGLDNRQYSGHSFRVGAATSCSAAGIEDHLIQTLGRWSSNCYIRYIHTPLSAISRAQRQMCSNRK